MRSKKRIVFIEHTNKFAGGQRVLFNILNTLAVEYDISFLYPHGGALANRLNELNENIKLIPLNFEYLNDTNKKVTDYFKFILFNIRNIKIIYNSVDNRSIIILNGGRLLLSTYIVSILRLCKVLCYIHIELNIFYKILYLIFLISPFDNKYIINSDFNLCSFVKQIPSFFIKHKTILLANGLSKKYSSLKYVNHFKKNKAYNFLVPGTLTPDKGQDILIELAKKYPMITFHIVGDIPQYSKNWANKLLSNKASNIIYYGVVEDLIEFINLYDVRFSLIPSRWNESFGLVAIESMSMSLLTITSAKGELKNISIKTNSLTYEKTNDLHLIIDRIIKMDLNSLSVLSKQQFENTSCHYSENIFNDNLKKIIKNEID